MRKSSRIVIAVSLCLFALSGLASAGTFDEAFKNASTSGQFRFAYISVVPDVSGTKTTTGAAFGGEIKFETAKWNNIQFAIAPYFSEKLDQLSGDSSKSELNGDFFDINGESFAYLGEAYVNYGFNQGSVRLGRQKLDNPFLNIDEIHILPNTFNAAWLTLNLSHSLTLDAGLVTHWAGFDSGQSIDKFKKTSNDGVSVLGLSYTKSDALSAQAWYYNFDQSYSQLYADITYSRGALEIGAQVSNYTEINASGTDGSVLGLSISYATGPFTLAAAINSGNNAASKSASNGLGGGNYYTSMDETTIDGLNDAKARVFSVEYAATEKFMATVAIGHFEDNGKSTEINETDLILVYSLSDTLNLEFTHCIVDNKSAPADPATNFSRQFARATYLF